MTKELYTMLKTSAEADKAKALLSLELLVIMQLELETIQLKIFIKMLKKHLLC